MAEIISRDQRKRNCSLNGLKFEREHSGDYTCEVPISFDRAVDKLEFVSIFDV